MFQPEIFAENLRKLRKRQGLSQGQLAQKLFVSTQAISKWERGETVPDISHICLLSGFFGITTDALLGNTPHTEKTLIAVDGGGTKTEFVLINLQGALLKRLVLPGSNPNLYGIDSACSVLKTGIEAMLQVDSQVMGIFIGGSGMGVGGNRQVVQSTLKAVYPHIQIFCDTDIRNVLACSDDPNNCIAAICGTGSVVYACSDGELTRLGGSGYLFDKLGSGYDVGRSAIFAALEHRDGTGPETILTEMIEARLGCRVWDYIHELYKKETSYIASFAPLVFQAYTQADPVAIEIIESNCNRLLKLIQVAAQKAPKAKSVILSGSLFSKSDIFYNKLSSMLTDGLQPQVPTLPQIWGACVQCAKLCGCSQPSAELFMTQYQIVASER